MERELAMKKADQVKEDTKTKVEAETVLDEARMIELRRQRPTPVAPEPEILAHQAGNAGDGEADAAEADRTRAGSG